MSSQPPRPFPRATTTSGHWTNDPDPSQPGVPAPAVSDLDLAAALVEAA